MPVEISENWFRVHVDPKYLFTAKAKEFFSSGVNELEGLAGNKM